MPCLASVKNSQLLQPIGLNTWVDHTSLEGLYKWTISWRWDVPIMNSACYILSAAKDRSGKPCKTLLLANQGVVYCLTIGSQPIT